MKKPESFSVDKSLMLDSMGRYLTQSLFLEFAYNEDAIYSLKEQDHFHNGRVYYSIKRIYLEMADPTEYEFANAAFSGWKHWQKICDNKAIRKHIDEWRSELEYKLRCSGIKALIAQGTTGNFQAAKWLADRGWDTRGAGRPSKEEVQREKEFQSRAQDEFSGDVLRLLKNG
jgi:hypothetical protein